MVKKNRNSIGIMQGRLTSSKGRGIQFFPFDNWENEFKIAAAINLNEIEFIFDLYNYRQNPLWSKKGRIKIISLVKKTGVKVNSICADYFMRRPFFGVSSKIHKSNIAILKRLIKNAREIGATLIEIPLVDNSSIKNNNDGIKFIKSIKECIPVIEKYNIRIGLETDLSPRKFATLIKKINHTMVGANYDSGNSASLGFDPQEEMKLFGKRVFNIHIKDRLYGGGTTPLGTGDARFNTLFRFLKKMAYNGSFILQVARGEDGNEVRTIESQITFLKKLWI